MKKPKRIPKSIQKLCWYGQSEGQIDSRDLITLVLNRGTIQDIRWLLDTFDRREIKDCVTKPSKGQWDPKSLNLWQMFFKLELSKATKELAIRSFQL